MNLAQHTLIMNAFIFSQFGYCPLVWMFHSRKLNNRINNIHERALRIVYRDYKSTFKQLLKQNKSVSIHQRNLQILATEIFKAKMVNRNNVSSVKYGTEIITSLGAKNLENFA